MGPVNSFSFFDLMSQLPVKKHLFTRLHFWSSYNL